MSFWIQQGIFVPGLNGYTCPNLLNPHTMKLTTTQTSLLAGASTVFAIFPQVTVTRCARVITPLYRPQASSLEALRSDWMKIGADIQRVLEQPDDIQNSAG